MREDETSLTEQIAISMRKGGDKLDFIFGPDKPYYYYAIAGTAAGIVMGEDISEEQFALISRITPAIVNLVVGTSDEIGLNEKAQYTIILGKEKT